MFSSDLAFIPAAERYDLMPAIDRWVITETFSIYKQALQQKTGESHNNCTINLSGASLNNDQFPDFILQQFNRHDMPTQLICFEITETALIVEPEKTVQIIQAISDLGCKISLDDFGNGFSSLSHLHSFPIDIVKID